MTQMNKGFFFETDFLTAIITILLISLIIFAQINSAYSKQYSQTKNFELQTLALTLADELVKTRDTNNPLFGSAVFDPQTKQVKPHTIDFELLSKASPAQINGFLITGIFIEIKGSQKEAIFYSKTDGNCIAVERFVWLKKENKKSKAKMELVVCNEK